MSEPVVIVRYDPAWPARFAAERVRLVAALAGHEARVEHVGSTAVPGASTSAAGSRAPTRCTRARSPARSGTST
jgi:GrpB-like predicted nucleotidyltransferase (UPF0157 family)